MQPTTPVGNLGLSALELQALSVHAQLTVAICLSEADQATLVEGANAGRSRDNTMKTGCAYKREEAPAYFPFAKNPGFWHDPALCGGLLGAENLDPETSEHLWLNEQSLPISNPEACVGPRASVDSLVEAVNPSIADTCHLPACVATDIVGSMDDVMGGGVHDGGMSRDRFHHAGATPANPEDRFGMIPETCEATEFPSTDFMATEYYTVSFPASGYWTATQSRSRSRNLPELMDNLWVASSPWAHEREDPWTFDEPDRFRERMLRFAENILTSEVDGLGMAQGDQSAGVAPVLDEQSSVGMGPDGNSTASRRVIGEIESFEELKPHPSYWLTNGSM